MAPIMSAMDSRAVCRAPHRSMSVPSSRVATTFPMARMEMSEPAAVRSRPLPSMSGAKCCWMAFTRLISKMPSTRAANRGERSASAGSMPAS